jgi:hypothetical protein
MAAMATEVHHRASFQPIWLLAPAGLKRSHERRRAGGALHLTQQLRMAGSNPNRLPGRTHKSRSNPVYNPTAQQDLRGVAVTFAAIFSICG